MGGKNEKSCAGGRGAVHSIYAQKKGSNLDKIWNSKMKAKASDKWMLNNGAFQNQATQLDHYHSHLNYTELPNKACPGFRESSSKCNSFVNGIFLSNDRQCYWQHSGRKCKKWTQLIRELRRCYLNGREDNGTGQDVKEGVHLSRAYFCHRWARKRNFRAV